MANSDIFYMSCALELAKRAYALGETPVGCVIVSEDKIIAEAFNLRETEGNAAAHAELLAIQLACSRLGGWRLHNCTLYVTLEPCAMCGGAIVNARIRRVVYAAPDPKAGAFGSVLNLNSYPLNHKPEIVSGVMRDESAQLLSEFFRGLRESNTTHGRATET